VYQVTITHEAFQDKMTATIELEWQQMRKAKKKTVLNSVQIKFANPNYLQT